MDSLSLDPPACFSGELPCHYSYPTRALPFSSFPPTSSTLSSLCVLQGGGGADAAASQHPCKRRPQATDDATGIAWCYNRHCVVLQPASRGAGTICSKATTTRCFLLEPAFRGAATSFADSFNQQCAVLRPTEVSGEERYVLLEPCVDFATTGNLFAGTGDGTSTTGSCIIRFCWNGS